jgi:hypothetical protein
MMTSIDSSYMPRLYACEECRCILGVVLRNKNKVRRLFVFRRHRTSADDVPACDVLMKEAEHPTRRHSIYNIHNMDQGSIECGNCHAIQEWMMSQEALDELHQRRSMVPDAQP